MIPHNKPSSSPNEQKYISQVLQSRQLTNGIFTNKFENSICDLLNLPHGHAVAVSSGSAALYISLMLLNASNKTIAMPAYVCSSLKQATKLANAQCKVLDINVGYPSIKQKALDNSHADILINPYLYGLASQLPTFSGPIIEDCAQALGASINGKYLGTRSDIGILSFYATKLITSGGQGGMIISKNLSLINLARDFINFDMQKDGKLRFNFFMTEVQAAIGLSQLEHYPEFLNKRQKIWNTYQKYQLPLLDNPNKSTDNIRFRAVIKTDKAKHLISHLASKGINAIVPIEDWELLDPRAMNSTDLSQNTVSLPIYPDLEQAEYIAKTVSEYL
ncbi:hypothetical protein CJF42_22495 [Pseudoalteromonas sp. NBT06-2]|uniref:DegT/DnrJ/EryC1/StrS family aminotransferase n=1 Tax=Pseudoalteromonas sp. NBT06-2 TaxID=2025950 RepID=UPI000BA6AE93|nr:DegT/DnrJ/EryC1/StrS aminotransferase family protein [Pseudoalteromonas sp. NBT06-2]PAJ72193.1 hypothetical protein CJF42_22495 [Pseudoalteromonas sp. NBT06-2]